MFTDMVDFTALIQEDERRTNSIRDRHRDALRVSIERHGGEIVQFYGDGTLSVFDSAIGGVNAAVEAQRRLREGEPPPRFLCGSESTSGTSTTMRTGCTGTASMSPRASRICRSRGLCSCRARSEALSDAGIPWDLFDSVMIGAIALNIHTSGAGLSDQTPGPWTSTPS